MSFLLVLQALYDYRANYEDELSFSEAMIIPLVRQVDSDWWEGLIDGKKGLIPANYIQILEPPATCLKARIVHCISTCHMSQHQITHWEPHNTLTYTHTHRTLFKALMNGRALMKVRM